MNNPILAGLARLHRCDPQSGYTAQRIAVEGWKANKDLLGLEGFVADYPDAQLCYQHLNAALADGHVDFDGKTGLYALSEAGWAAVGEAHGASAHLNLVGRLLKTKAFGEFSYHAKGRIEAEHAAEFWAAADHERVEQAVVALLSLMQAAESANFGGLFITQSLLRNLRYCNDYLKERFGMKADFFKKLMVTPSPRRRRNKASA